MNQEYQLTSCKELLTPRYRNSETARALIDALREISETEIHETAKEVAKMGSAEARGKWLDWLAARFGILRPMKPADGAKFFGFAGNPGAVGFNQAPFRPRELIGSLIPISDIVFGPLALSLATGLRFDGTQNGLNQLLSQAYPGSYAFDNQDMTYDVYLDLSAYLEDDRAALTANGAGLPKPAGVKMNLIVVT